MGGSPPPFASLRFYREIGGQQGDGGYKRWGSEARVVRPGLWGKFGRRRCSGERVGVLGCRVLVGCPR